MSRSRWDFIVGCSCIAVALITLLAWIPADVETGIIEKVRRQVSIGDAMAPTLWAILIGIVGLVLAIGNIGALRLPSSAVRAEGPSMENLRYMGQCVVIMVVALLATYWTGPIAVSIGQGLGMDIGSYRELRDTPPWKYLGYVSGAFIMNFGMLSLIQGRFTKRLATIALITAIMLAAIYDLPFDSLQLPPNGDM